VITVTFSTDSRNSLLQNEDELKNNAT